MVPSCGCIPAYPTRRKGALGPLLSALVGASKGETPTANLTQSTGMDSGLLREQIQIAVGWRI